MGEKEGKEEEKKKKEEGRKKRSRRRNPGMETCLGLCMELLYGFVWNGWNY